MPNEFLADPPPLPRLFSIRAVSIGTFVGGPLTAGLFMGLNFRRLGNFRAANIAFVVGIVATALMFWGILVLPPEIGDRIPRHLIPALYTPLAAYLAKRFQGDAIDRAIEKGARKVSGWVITGWSIVSLIATFGALVPFALTMPPLGFHGDKQTFGPNGAYEVYSSGNVSQSDIKALAEYLTRCEYFNGEERHLAQVVKQGNIYTLSLPFERQYWDKPELLASLKNIRAEIEQTILKGKLTLVLVDEDYNRTYRKEL